MKRTLIFACLLFLTWVGITGCYKDVILPKQGADPNAPPVQYSFKTDIAPMLNTRVMPYVRLSCRGSAHNHPTWQRTYPGTSLSMVGLLIPCFPSKARCIYRSTEICRYIFRMLSRGKKFMTGSEPAL